MAKARSRPNGAPRTRPRRPATPRRHARSAPRFATSRRYRRLHSIAAARRVGALGRAPPSGHRRRIARRAGPDAPMCPHRGAADALSFSRPGVRAQTLRQLRRGRYPIEDELDLHGLSQSAARDQLAEFISSSRQTRPPLRSRRARQGLSLGRARSGSQDRREYLAQAPLGRAGVHLRARHRRRYGRRVRAAALRPRRLSILARVDSRRRGEIADLAQHRGRELTLAEREAQASTRAGLRFHLQIAHRAAQRAALLLQPLLRQKLGDRRRILAPRQARCPKRGPRRLRLAPAPQRAGRMDVERTRAAARSRRRRASIRKWLPLPSRLARSPGASRDQSAALHAAREHRIEDQGARRRERKSALGRGPPAG